MRAGATMTIFALSMVTPAMAGGDEGRQRIVCPAGTTKREAGTDAHETWCQRGDGTRHGPYRYVWQYTQEEGLYRNGKRHGRWVQASINVVARGSYLDDLEEGLWTFFYEGKKSAVGRYRRGRRDGNWTFYFDGQVTERGVYLNGVKYGRWEFFLWGPGTTVLECHGEKPHGMLIQRDTNGRLVRSGKYVDGVMVGWWMEHTGSRLVRGRYEAGHLVEGEAVDTAGGADRLGFREGISGHLLCRKDYEADYRVTLL
jgi:hypothetical protein